jgi:hypothetical protein
MIEGVVCDECGDERPEGNPRPRLGEEDGAMEGIQGH